MCFGAVQMNADWLINGLIELARTEPEFESILECMINSSSLRLAELLSLLVVFVAFKLKII